MSGKLMFNDIAQGYNANWLKNILQPKANPILDDKDYTTEKSLTETFHYGLNQYPYSNSGTNSNPIKTTYNDKNVVSGLFLVTQNFLDFVNRMNEILESGTLPNIITELTYRTNATTGGQELDPDNPKVVHQQVIDAFSGPAGNNAEVLDKFEKTIVSLGMYHTSTTGGAPTSSTISELFLRHLYSKDKTKRAIAFSFAKSFYGVTASLVDAAEREILAFEDYNSDDIEFTMEGNKLVVDYKHAIKLEKRYTDTIDNPTSKTLYLYFPVFGINGLSEEDLMVPLGLNNPTEASQQGSGNYKFKTTQFRDRGQSGKIGNLILDYEIPCLTNWLPSKARGGNLVPQISYIAGSLVKEGSVGDIHADYVHQISHLNKFKWELVLHPTVS